MRDELLLWRTKCDLELLPIEIRARFPEESNQTDSGSYVFLDSVFKDFIQLRYEWRITSTEDAFRLEEKAFIPTWTFLVAAVSLVMIFLSLTFLPFLLGVWRSMALVLTTLFVIAFIVFTGVSTLIDSPVSELLGQGAERREYMPVATFLIGVMPFFVGFGFGDWRIRWLCIAGIAAWSTTYVLFHDKVVQFSVYWQSTLLNRTTSIPLVAGNYLAGLLLASIVQVLFIGATGSRFFTEFMLGTPFPVLYAVLIVFLLFYFCQVVGQGQKIESTQFEQYGQTDINPKSYYLTGLVAVVGSAVYAGLTYVFLTTGMQYITTYSSLGVYLVFVLSGLPALYYFSGILYQALSFLYSTTVLIRTSRYLDEAVSDDYPVRVLTSEACVAGAVDLGFTRFVLVSEGLLEQLSEEELRAVVAHEEAHFELGDTKIAFGIGVLSSVLLTGRNILYGVLGFRGRELRADRRAASKVGEESLIEALNTLQEIEADEKSSPIPGFLPTVNSFHRFKPESVTRNLYGFYYGEFALSGVHPNLSERKKAIRRG
jgi:Zn-dependent protease with chaperone function